MRVFVTGASGHIGSALVPELLGNGHQVVGLARSDRSAAALEAAGAEVWRGDLDDLDGLRAAAAAADGVIHLAFKHEAMAIRRLPRRDRRRPQGDRGDGRRARRLGQALRGHRGHADARVRRDQGPAQAPNRTWSRAARASTRRTRVIGFAERGIRSSIIRLSPLVHSSLDHHGFAHLLIGIARAKGVSGYVGDGANRWPAVHTLDAARLYRLALESAPAGSRLHGVADEGVPFRDIAEVIGRRLGLPVESVDPQDAGEHFGFLGSSSGSTTRRRTRCTRELLGWEPTHEGLLDDLNHGHYFDSVTA